MHRLPVFRAAYDDKDRVAAVELHLPALETHEEGAAGHRVDPLNAGTEKGSWWKKPAPVIVQTEGLLSAGSGEAPAVLYVSVEQDVISSARTVKADEEVAPRITRPIGGCRGHATKGG